MTINGKSVDGVLWIQTRDRRMVGADESTELWWPLWSLCFLFNSSPKKIEFAHRDAADLVRLVGGDGRHLVVDRRFGCSSAGTTATEESCRKVCKSAAPSSTATADDAVDEDGRVLERHLHDGVDGRITLPFRSLKLQKNILDELTKVVETDHLGIDAIYLCVVAAVAVNYGQKFHRLGSKTLYN